MRWSWVQVSFVVFALFLGVTSFRRLHAYQSSLFHMHPPSFLWPGRHTVFFAAHPT